jgi:hypothetical protein
VAVNEARVIPVTTVTGYGRTLPLWVARIFPSVVRALLRHSARVHASRSGYSGYGGYRSPGRLDMNVYGTRTVKLLSKSHTFDLDERLTFAAGNGAKAARLLTQGVPEDSRGCHAR